MSAPQEAGDVAKSVITGLRDRPDFLALIVLNLIMFGLFAYLSYSRAQNQHMETLKLFEACYGQRGNGGPH